LAKAEWTGIPFDAYSTGDQIKSRLAWSLTEAVMDWKQCVIYGRGVEPVEDPGSARRYFICAMADGKVLYLPDEKALREKLLNNWHLKYEKLRPIDNAFAEWTTKAQQAARTNRRDSTK